MPRSARDAGERHDAAEPHRGRQNTAATAPPPERLSPAKRRIAQALAALLVAHYRRQPERAKCERAPDA